ncbi:ABC transporter ATP-binding protein [Bariatricus massiliensis]|uniref:ABC transporter ATP-binding protein n=1 Tax=Bariatricus massiliensis TaxID=1745713 RepID=A0ABS8DI01_9FIRM|nr:ABC transporter ATP-binding protein [Bariatricus massiliensis]MCB7304971.1 ABC transporter ATP-binding protein [Bariatricus massiliensis]MCB7375525.1 ABC transporter ATP-binding protein [Bariatricus massiliensis]MCB7387985.1 ABC transporter ATP-binding protein [Bariatricus massiliensis]MCB7412195.1 ABC transporter ATP-binding protein [Bariatricus massiliensis]MCQ5253280.1 ABC transporter ATP-binding protein [Bariatricus massiliensis]
MNNNEKQPLVQVKNVCKYFKVGKKADLKAVDHVSFDVYKGETVGVVGESGCGKSTLGRCMIRLYEPTSGEVLYEGQDITKLSREEQKAFCKKVQMIFQNPYASLNSRMTVKEIVGEGLKQHGYPNKEIEQRVQTLLETVGLNKDHMSRFPHEFSGGQRQRIGIARALSVEPDFIICDEPISALDVSVQAQVINMLKELQQERGLTYLFIAHDLSVVKYISDRVVVMYLGTVVETAETEELYNNTLHPYTKALISAIPEADPDKAKSSQRIPIKGEIPSPINPPDCCRFVERCQYATDRCRKEKPELREVCPGHQVACHLV